MSVSFNLKYRILIFTKREYFGQGYGWLPTESFSFEECSPEMALKFLKMLLLPWLWIILETLTKQPWTYFTFV